MKRRLLLAATMFVQAGCPRGNDAGAELGELGDLVGGYARITIAGDRVYRSPGDFVETIDLANPSRPVLLGEAATGLGCFFYCSGIHAVGDTAYASSLGQVVQSSVPTSGSPDWISPYSFVGEAGFDPVSETVVLAAGSAVTGSADEIVIVDLSGATPAVLSSASEAVLAQAVWGGRAFLTNASNGLAVYDLNDPALPSLVGRMDLAPADGWTIAPAAPFIARSIAATSTSDLFALSVDPGVPGFTPPCRLNWFQLGGTAATLRADTAEEDFAGCSVVVAAGDLVFVGYTLEASHPEEADGGLAIYRADAALGLIKLAEIDLAPTDIAIDTVRGLLVASTVSEIHVFDLNALAN